MVRFFFGTFLLAHGLVHLLYLMPVPENDPNWPFLLEESWIIPEAARRGVGRVLVMAIVALSLLAALGVWGLPGTTGLLTGVIVAGSTLSLVLFAAYWHPWLSVGVLIAVTLAVSAITRPAWCENLIA